MSYVFPACDHFLLRELAGEALRSILRRGSCSFAALTSARLLAACPQPTSYGFSHCRALSLGTDRAGPLRLLPRDAQSLLGLHTAQKLFAEPHQHSSFSPLMRRAEDEFPTTKMQALAVWPPTCRWLFGVTTSCCEPAGHLSHISSSSGWRNTGGTRRGRARTVIQRGARAVRRLRVPQPGPRLQSYQTQILLILQPTLLYL